MLYNLLIGKHNEKGNDMIIFEILGWIMMSLGPIIVLLAYYIREYHYAFRKPAAYIYTMYAIGFIVLMIGCIILLIAGISGY